MIWVRGEVVPDEALSISVLDRTFEHGLGLFETLRTWAGRPALLPRHLARLARSAAELGLPIDPASLPDAEAVSALIEAEGVRGDVALRITTSGGREDGGAPVVWMRTRPLPPEPDGPIRLHAAAWEVGDDPTQRHKTLNYWAKRLTFEHSWQGADWPYEVLVEREGQVWEGTRSNLFLVEGENLVTPHLDGPVLPGVMRAFAIETARDLGWPVLEGDVTLRRVYEADEVFLTNAVRGIIPATWDGSDGPDPSKAEQLRAEVVRRLEGGAIRP